MMGDARHVAPAAVIEESRLLRHAVRDEIDRGREAQQIATDLARGWPARLYPTTNPNCWER